MSERDPAARRFATIQLVRILGVAFIVGGLLVANGRWPGPDWLGYVLIANGLVDAFVIPPILIRKWRSPQ
jgi:hypothetical protein